MSEHGSPYAQLHENNIPALLASHRVGADTLLAPGRTPSARLDGSWRFMPDIYDGGLRAAWYREAGGEFEPEGPRDYDFDAARPVEVPACWNSYGPEYLLYEGSGWFFRTFAASIVDAAAESERRTGASSPDSELEEHRTILRFGAANYATLVFLNGVHVASHLGGFTPFCVDITDHLAGTNRLHVWVSNARKPDAVPAEFTDWFNYGGLYREVALYRAPPVSITDYTVELAIDRTDVDGAPTKVRPLSPGNGSADGRRFTADRIRVAVRLSAPVSRPVTITIDGLARAQGRTDAAGLFTTEIAASPDLWSPERPTLYDVTVRCGADEITDRIGFRYIETNGTQIYLNGAPLFLRGVALHEDHPDRFRSLNDADRRRIFAEAKELGCNFLRLAHYPHHERTARLADELGMLLWEEIPVYWSLKFDSPEVLDNARNQLSELIRRDRHRVSVILWSVGNENPDTDERRRFMRALAEHAKRLDPTRLVTAACLVDIENDRINDRLAADLDVIGVNEYYGWYYGDDERLKTFFSQRFEKPVVVSEFGAAAVAGRHGDEYELWSEQMQERVVRRQLEVMIGSRTVAGSIPWLLFDFRTPRRMNPHQGMFNRKGLLNEDLRRRKRAFYAVREIYRAMRDR